MKNFFYSKKYGKSFDIETSINKPTMALIRFIISLVIIACMICGGFLGVMYCGEFIGRFCLWFPVWVITGRNIMSCYMIDSFGFPISNTSSFSAIIYNKVGTWMSEYGDTAKYITMICEHRVEKLLSTK